MHTPIWINLGDSRLSDATLIDIEQAYNGDYIGDFCVKMPNGTWSTPPVAVFYRETPDLSKGHSHYMGCFLKDGRIWLTNAISVAEAEWTGVVAADGEILISRFRHDTRVSRDGSVSIDGGQDYIHTSSPTIPVVLDGPGIAAVRRIARAKSLSPSDPRRMHPDFLSTATPMRSNKRTAKRAKKVPHMTPSGPLAPTQADPIAPPSTTSP